MSAAPVFRDRRQASNIVRGPRPYIGHPDRKPLRGWCVTGERLIGIQAKSAWSGEGGARAWGRFWDGQSVREHARVSFALACPTRIGACSRTVAHRRSHA
jgi:hypothetical protein